MSFVSHTEHRLSIINSLLLRVAEDFVGITYFSELFFGPFGTRSILIRMESHRSLPKFLLDLSWCGILLDSKYFVVILFISLGARLTSEAATTTKSIFEEASEIKVTATRTASSLSFAFLATLSLSINEIAYVEGKLFLLA